MSQNVPILNRKILFLNFLTLCEVQEIRRKERRVEMLFRHCLRQRKFCIKADLCANPDSAHRGATNAKVIHLIVALQLRNTVEICFLIHSPGIIGYLFFTS